MNLEMQKAPYFRGRAIVLLLLLLASYVSSFILLSRFGYSSAHGAASTGYYFVSPFSDNGQHSNLVLARIYWPLIEIDARLISGQRPGTSPLELLTCVNGDRYRK